MTPKILILSLSILLLSACITTTPYADLRTNQEDGYGYTSSRLGNDRFRVTFRANTNTPFKQVYDFTLLRCAEICLEAGFSRFAITSENDSGSYDFSGSSIIASSRRQQRVYNITIQCFGADEDIRGQLFVVADITRDLRAKYQLPPPDRK